MEEVKGSRKVWLAACQARPGELESSSDRKLCLKA